MNGTSSNGSFFSFGPNDSFISRSFQGLKYRNLPSELQNLILRKTASDIYWAVLGPIPDSWILNFKDVSNKNTIRWGQSIPKRLQTILAKTWHSPHLRAFLGPDDSFIVWHPELIRWTNLPPDLEDTLQSWLTPSGWRVGPPRIVTWGPNDAFFAISEYGTVAYDFSDEDEEWEIYKETVEEWKAEKGFLWSELAFIALDPTASDQFIAIRNDGTWAGSADDGNEDALEAFALNFFARARAQANEHSSPGTPIPKPADAQLNAATQALYSQWSKETAAKFSAALSSLTASKSVPPPRKLQVRSQSSAHANSVTVSFDIDTPSPRRSSTSTSPAVSNQLLATFPYLPPSVTTCALPPCALAKSVPDDIKACRHDVERFFRASGSYGYEWLRQERLRWHPDRFGRLCEEEWRETGKRMAEEMFKIIDGLMEEVKEEGE